MKGNCNLRRIYMSEFYVDLNLLKKQVGLEGEIVHELANSQVLLQNQKSNLCNYGLRYQNILNVLQKVTIEVKNHEKEMVELQTVLETTIKLYESTEYQIVSGAIGAEKVFHQDYSNKSQEEVEKAYKNGEIDEETFRLLKSLMGGTWGALCATLQTMLNNFLQGKSSEALANTITSWLMENTPFFMDRGLITQLVQGGEVLLTESPSWLASLIRGGAKYGIPIVGTLIDFGLQIGGGEEIGDAAVKSAAHTAFGLGAVAAGSKIGLAIGTAIPGAGSIVGAVAGAAIAAVGSLAFDYIYDNLDDITAWAGEALETVGNSIGNAIDGVFQGLGSVFG